MLNNVEDKCIQVFFMKIPADFSAVEMGKSIDVKTKVNINNFLSYKQ